MYSTQHNKNKLLTESVVTCLRVGMFGNSLEWQNKITYSE